MTLRVAGGAARGVPLAAVNDRGVRPTSERTRSALFSILAAYGLEGCSVLDLYAGTGALGIEALSRGAARADFVERSANQCRLIRQNLKAAKVEDCARVFCAPVRRVLDRLEGPYRFILADPPYECKEIQSLMSRLSEASWLEPGGVLVLEHSVRNVPAHAFNALSLVQSRRYGDSCLSLYSRGA